MTEPLTLYVDSHWVSPYALTAFVALEEYQVPHRVEEVALFRGEQRALGAATQRVPAIRQGDFVLSESLAIAEYVAEAFEAPAGRALFPRDVRQRAHAREIMGWIRSDLMPIREERATYTVFYEPASTPLSESGERAALKLVGAAEAWVREGHTTLFDAWCLADTDLTMMLQRLHHSGYPLPAKVVRYVEANWARPSVRKWIDRARPAYTAY